MCSLPLISPASLLFTTLHSCTLQKYWIFFGPQMYNVFSCLCLEPGKLFFAPSPSPPTENSPLTNQKWLTLTFFQALVIWEQWLFFALQICPYYLVQVLARGRYRVAEHKWVSIVSKPMALRALLWYCKRDDASLKVLVSQTRLGQTGSPYW